MHVEFRWETSQCCSFCNSVNLADFERDCVEVEGPGVSAFICEDCLGVLGELATNDSVRVLLHPDVALLSSADGQVLSSRTCECSATWSMHVHCPRCNAPHTFGAPCPRGCR